MAKRKLILNEGTTRKFMKYANIKPTYVSNFLNEAEEELEEGAYGMGNREDEEEKLEEQEEEMAEEPAMDADMEVEDEMDMKADEGGDAESLVMDLLSKIQEFAEENGVSMELEGDEDMEDMDDEGMDDMDAAPEGGDLGMADDEVDADLEAAGAEAVDDEEVIAEVTRRVARRLLRESARRK